MRSYLAGINDKEGFQRALEGAKESLAYYEGQSSRSGCDCDDKRYIQNCEILLERRPRDGERKYVALSDQIDKRRKLCRVYRLYGADGYNFVYADERDGLRRYKRGKQVIFTLDGRIGYSGFYDRKKRRRVLLTEGAGRTQAKEIAAHLTDDLELCLVAPVHGNKALRPKEGWRRFCPYGHGVTAAFDSKDFNSDMYYGVPFAQLNEQMTIGWTISGLPTSVGRSMA
jgi:hypothetical protein